MNTKKQRLWTASIVALFMVAMLSSCKDENKAIIGICPVVVSTSPSNLATGVPLDKIITVTFNEKLNPLTITPQSISILALNSKQKATSIQITGNITYDAANYTIRFKPTSLLESGVTYSGTVFTTIQDLTGNALQVKYSWTFTTGSSLSPTIISTDPSPNAIGVYLNKTVSATFSETMDPLSFTNETFTLKQGINVVSGTILYTGTSAFFKPSGLFTANTLYTVTIKDVVKNLAGTTLATDSVWTFTTGSIVAPSVNATDPTDLSTNVVLTKSITATFSEPMDPLTLTASTFTMMAGTSSVSGLISYSGSTVTFKSASNLLSGTTYTVTIKSLAKNMTGIPLANDYRWTFTTKTNLGPATVDLGNVARFGIIAGVGISNNAGFSEIRNMDVGIYPGVRSSITGFPPAVMVNGAIYASDDIAPPGIAAMLLQAQNDLKAAYLFAEGAVLPAPSIVSGDQGGKTLAPGIYKSMSTLLIQSGDLTLDAQGDVNAVWIFQIASSFTTIGGAGGNVILTGGAQAKNVFWQTGSSATIGDYTSFKGNILALQSITMNSHAVVTGRMLARNGSVVLTGTNIIDKP